MTRPNAFRSMLIGCAMIAAVGSFAASSNGAVAKASDWLGSLVLAPNGEEIGTIRDLAVDPVTGKIVYIVVSVGSFLIEDNLIAVRPDALTQSDDHQWTLYTDVDTLRRAQRFATDKAWPARADVIRSARAEAEQPRIAKVPEPEQDTAAAQEGTATISTNTRTAYLSGGERYIKEVEPGLRTSPPPSATSPPRTSGATSALPPIEVADATDGSKFDRLDKDHDGVLNRSEIALQMGPRDKFSKVDANANGVVERGEFETLQAQHAQDN